MSAIAIAAPPTGVEPPQVIAPAGSVLAAAGARRLDGGPVARTIQHIAVRGSLHDAAARLSRQILLALAEEPAAVVGDLSGVMVPGAVHGALDRLDAGLDDNAVASLAATGSEVGTWPGTPVALVCPWPGLRQRLQQESHGGGLILGGTLASVLAEVESMPQAATVRTTLPAAARSVRAARDIVARTLLDWGCGSQIGMATMVVAELVSSAVAREAGDVGLSVSRCGEQVRIGVRGAGLAYPPTARAASIRGTGRAMLLIAALATSWGVLPCADGDRVVWVALSSDPSAAADRFTGAAARRHATGRQHPRNTPPGKGH